MLKLVFQNPVVWAFVAAFVLELVFLLYISARPSKGKVKTLMAAEILTFLAAVGLCVYYDGAFSHFRDSFVFVFISIIYGFLLFVSAAVCGTRLASHPKN